MLEDDGEDDDAGGCEEGPGEEDHLAGAAARGERDGHAVQGGIFFLGAAGRVFGGARAVGQERSPLRPRGLQSFASDKGIVE